MTPLDQQTVLVTGATGGLGRALVRRFADHGTHVVAHGRSTDRLGGLVTEVESATGQHIDTVQADLAEQTSATWTVSPTRWSLATTPCTCWSTTPAWASALQALPARRASTGSSSGSPSTTSPRTASRHG